MIEREFVKHLVKRLARIDASGVWSADLNPAQRAALEYLGRANRFSRKPSQVAEFLGSTRGTVSQTLKSLARKGFVRESPSGADKRSISYEVTAVGKSALAVEDILTRSLDGMPSDQLEQVADGLRHVLENALTLNGQRAFGLCRNCKYHTETKTGGHCNLLDVALLPLEATQICREQKPLT